MTDGIIQQVFRKHNMIYLADEHRLNELQQELIEKIRQERCIYCITNKLQCDILSEKRLIGDNKE